VTSNFIFCLSGPLKVEIFFWNLKGIEMNILAKMGRGFYVALMVTKLQMAMLRVTVSLQPPSLLRVVESPCRRRWSPGAGSGSDNLVKFRVMAGSTVAEWPLFGVRCATVI
jgi:hypothetical protein